MFVVDTNILVYSSETGFPEHEGCRRRLNAWREQAGAWYSTWGILYEFMRVVTHPRVFRSPWSPEAAWSFVEGLLAATGFGVLTETERHFAVVREVLRDVPHVAGNLVHDAHTAVLMKEHGIRTIYTRDTNFHRFPLLDVQDPLT